MKSGNPGVMKTPSMIKAAKKRGLKMTTVGALTGQDLALEQIKKTRDLAEEVRRKLHDADFTLRANAGQEIAANQNMLVRVGYEELREKLLTAARLLTEVDGTYEYLMKQKWY